MKRIGVFTSGGDAPGMNANIRAVVRYGIAKGIEVFAIRRGFEGMIAGNIYPFTETDVSGIIGRGGTVIGTARSQEFMTPEGRQRAFIIYKNIILRVLLHVVGMELSLEQIYFMKNTEFQLLELLAQSTTIFLEVITQLVLIQLLTLQ